MTIDDLREWATETYGAHSHKEGQVLAALGPLDEWLGHLARHGVMLELWPKETALSSERLPPLPPEEPAAPPVAPVVEVPAPSPTLEPAP